MNRIVIVLLLAATSAGTSLLACAGSRDARGEAMDTAAMPDDIRADYEVFARRCSKCHSLARPLNSGIDDDDFWTSYVARMRRQPGSGITQADAVVILRFLHYFSVEQRRIKANGGATNAPANAHGAPSGAEVTPASPPASHDAPDAARMIEPPAAIDGGA